MFEQQDIRALSLVFGQHPDEQGFEGVVLAQSLENGNEAEGEKPPAAFLVGLREGGNADAEADHFVFLIENEAGKVLVDEGDVLLDIHVYLLFAQFGELIQLAERVVEHVEQVVARLEQGFAVFLGHFLEPETGLDQVGVLEHHRELLGQFDDALRPVGVLAEAHFFKQFAVVREIVDAGGRGKVLKPFDQQTFLVHIRKAQRTFQLGHFLRLAPFGHLADERAEQCFVFDEIQPAETNNLLVPVCVGVIINNSRDSAYDFAGFVASQPIHCVTELECGILAGKDTELVRVQRRHPVGSILVEAFRKENEFFQLLPRTNFFDCKTHLCRKISYWAQR